MGLALQCYAGLVSSCFLCTVAQEVTTGDKGKLFIFSFLYLLSPYSATLSAPCEQTNSHDTLSVNKDESKTLITIGKNSYMYRYLFRVGDIVPGVVVYFCHLHHHSSLVGRVQWAHKLTDSGCN